MNPVLILSYNQLALLQQCVASVRTQDIDCSIFVIDNGSTDGTTSWLESDEYGLNIYQDNETNIGVSRAWNEGLNYFWGELKPGQHRGWKYPDHVLVLNQDVTLPPNFYSSLLSTNLPFVTGCPVESPHELDEFDQQPHLLQSTPCFSAFLITRDCWERLGPFDERMFGWASDCDYHARAHALGVPLQMSRTPFQHRAGTTMRTAQAEEQQWFSRRATDDRAVFKQKWGCLPGTPEYPLLFLPELFGKGMPKGI